VSFKKYKSQGKAVEVTVNSKEENSLRLFSGFFVQNYAKLNIRGGRKKL
jgi:hypothetical protein